MLLESAGGPDRALRAWRIRGGAARTFGSLILSLCTLLVGLGGSLLYQAFAYPLTADAAQVLLGSVALALSLLLLFFLLYSRRPHGSSRC